MPPKDLSGQRFGRLVVEEVVGRKRGYAVWRCACDCGNTTEITTSELTRGAKSDRQGSRSCGCQVGYKATHGMKGHYLYILWVNMKARCYRETCPAYAYYGALGVTMKEEWKNDFEIFLADILEEIGGRPSESYSLDRISSWGNYEPGNIRWATALTQGRNQRKSIFNDPRKREVAIQMRDMDCTCVEIAKELSVSWGAVKNFLVGNCWEGVGDTPGIDPSIFDFSAAVIDVASLADTLEKNNDDYRPSFVIHR